MSNVSGCSTSLPQTISGLYKAKDTRLGDLHKVVLLFAEVLTPNQHAAARLTTFLAQFVKLTQDGLREMHATLSRLAADDVSPAMPACLRLHVDGHAVGRPAAMWCAGRLPSCSLLQPGPPSGKTYTNSCPSNCEYCCIGMLV